MVGQVVMATEAGTVAVVREGRIVGSKVLGTSGEWKKQNINQNHIMHHDKVGFVPEMLGFFNICK